MIEAANYISELVLIVSTHSEILTAELHIIYKAQLAFVINDVAFLAGDRYVPLLPANQKELVIRDV
jgi:hypothetical protein